MKRMRAGLLITVAVFLMAGCSSVSTRPTADAQSNAPTTPSQSASPNEAPETTKSSDTSSSIETDGRDLSEVDLLLMALMGPEGEYAAAASYKAVLDKYGDVEPYYSIYAAELRHVSALVRQLERLGEEVPANPYLGQLAAPASLEVAAKAWAEGEIENIELYDFLLAQTESPQLVRVFENLRAASQNSHLPAFEAAAANGGTLENFADYSN